MIYATLIVGVAMAALAIAVGLGAPVTPRDHPTSVADIFVFILSGCGSALITVASIAELLK